MLDYLLSHFRNKFVHVNVDSALHISIDSHEKISSSSIRSPDRIPINLFKLIIAVGTVHTRRTNPTNRNKFFDKRDLLEAIDSNSDEFRIIKHQDAEVQIQNSKELGVGLSVVIADYFYGLEWSTLTKIMLRHRQSKPDIKVFSSQRKQIVIEAKGTTDSNTRENIQKPEALNQKQLEPADVRIASCALLHENIISEVDFLDPKPGIPKNKWLNRKLFKADHYTRLFNFIGQRELSEYFSLMSKRLKFDKNFKKYSRKEELFSKIKKGYIRIPVKNKRYFGNIERIDENNYFFIGIDEKLISLQGFINFKDYPKDSTSEDSENYFYLATDGICFASLKSLKFIENQLVNKKIYHYQDTVSIIDIDMMNHFALNNFFVFLFEKVGCKVNREVYSSEFVPKKTMADFIVKYQNKRAVVEIKKIFKSKENVFNQLVTLRESLGVKNAILVTSEKISETYFQEANAMGISIIDRTAIKKIIKNHEILIKYL